MKRQFLLSIVLMFCAQMFAQRIVVNGVPWYDDRDSIVSAHGGNILRENGTYYLYGEYKTDSANVFNGFSCYSSTDLANWKWEGLALRLQADGPLGPNRVGERPKVVKCPSTGEFVMLLRSDNKEYKDPLICYATSKNVTGPYEFRGPMLFQGKQLKNSDLGSFVDDNGQAYLLTDNGGIYRLAADYHSLDMQVCAKIQGAGKSPAMFKKGDYYYLLNSQSTAWERNDNFYFAATDLAGPWVNKGNFAPKGSTTFNSQVSFVLPYNYEGNKQYIYIGDRWSYPHQHSCASYVWMPLGTENEKLGMPDFYPLWETEYCGIKGLKDLGRVDSVSCNTVLASPGQEFSLNQKVKENGRIAISGNMGPEGCYAEITLTQIEGWEEKTATVDFYSKSKYTGLVFLSPKLPKGLYKVNIRVSGMRPNWPMPDGSIGGSTGNKVGLANIYVIDQ